eukprot:424558-Amphidinium_carterae.1
MGQKYVLRAEANQLQLREADKKKALLKKEFEACSNSACTAFNFQPVDYVLLKVRTFRATPKNGTPKT